MLMPGLSVLNIELCSKCNKDCWMCGRRKVDCEYPEVKMNYGEMDLDLLRQIRFDLEGSYYTLIQFHKDGEPLMYSHLEEALKMFNGFIRCFNTNGKLLVERANEIIDHMETITISTFENDPEWEDQYQKLVKFLEIKGNRKPSVIIRTLGNIDKKRMELYNSLNLLQADRILHSPMGSFEYTRKTTVPEHGICLDLLSHLTIDRFGDVYPCVRFDPHKENKIGNVLEKPLIRIWEGNERRNLIDKFVQQKREEIPFCSKCQFWGIPRGN